MGTGSRSGGPRQRHRLQPVAGGSSAAGNSATTTRCGSGPLPTWTVSGRRSGTIAASRPPPRPPRCSAAARCPAPNGSPAPASTTPSRSCATSAPARRRCCSPAKPCRCRACVGHAGRPGAETRDPVPGRGRPPRQPGRLLLPNIPQTVIALLAAASIGAVWTNCSPDFGWRGVLDRFRQLTPKVLICTDGYRYGGREFGRRDESRGSRPGCRAWSTSSTCRCCTRRIPPADRGRRELGRGAESPGGPRRAVRLRAGPVRSSALDLVFLRHHRPAEGDHARPRRHSPGAAQAARPPTWICAPATGCSSTPRPAG